MHGQIQHWFYLNSIPERNCNELVRILKHEAIPYEVTQREWEASRTELLDLLGKITNEQLHTLFVLPWGQNGSIEDPVDIFVEHEETHAKEIREIIEKKIPASLPLGTPRI